MRHKYACCLCGQDPGMIFMVNDDLWKRVAKEHAKEIICWDCFERQLGRKITAADLKPDAPCNKVLRQLLFSTEVAMRALSGEVVQCVTLS